MNPTRKYIPVMSNEQIIEHANRDIDMRIMCTDYFDSVINRDNNMWQGHFSSYQFNTMDKDNIKLVITFFYGTSMGPSSGRKEISINDFRAWSAEYYK